MSKTTVKWILGLLIFLTFDLMLLGAGVRAMDAGLTCPDWPLCFGKVIPEYHFGVYLEFIHRAIAGVLALVYFLFVIGTLVWKELSPLRTTAFFAGLVLLSQVIMGALTVLKVLSAGIVTAHLVLATIFLLSLCFMKLQLENDETKGSYSPTFKVVMSFCFLFTFMQLIMGGLVASNYAGVACVDFPKCNGLWLPELSGPIGLQMLHRYGAYLLTVLFSALFILGFRSGNILKLDQKTKRELYKAGFFFTLQIVVGILNIKLLIPAWLTVLHLCLALLILRSLLVVNYRAWLHKL